MADDAVVASPTAASMQVAGETHSALLVPLTRLLAQHAARQHLQRRRHRGYGLIQIALGLGAVALFLIGALLLAQRLRGER